MIRWLARLTRSWTNADKIQDEIDEEISFHVQQCTHKYIEAGLPSIQARQEALKKFGRVEEFRATCQAIRGAGIFEWVARDLRLAWRKLNSHPTLTLVILFTMALGIGVNTAIFSLVNTVLLRPLPLPDSAQLVQIDAANGPLGITEYGMSALDYQDIKKGAQTFEEMALCLHIQAILLMDKGPKNIRARRVTASFFSLVQTAPILGRALTLEDENAGANPVAVLGYELWQKEFNGASNVIGNNLTINNQAHKVIGVMPANFNFPYRCQLWLPLKQDDDNVNKRGWRFGGLFARLREGIKLSQAQIELATISNRLEQENPETNRNWKYLATSILDKTVKDARPSLLILMAMALMLLLMSCLNVANIMLSQAIVRQKEMAIRSVLGANLWRILQQLLWESLLLGALGGGLGLFMAILLFPVMQNILPSFIPRLHELRMDNNVLVFVLSISFGCSLIFSLMPALHYWSVDLGASIKEGIHRPAKGFKWHAIRSGFVILQVALALILLVGAGLAIRSYSYLCRVDLGFSTCRLLVADISLDDVRYPKPENRQLFFADLIQSLAQRPGIQSICAASTVPLSHWSKVPVQISGQPDQANRWMDCSIVTLDYFATLEIPILMGRDFYPEEMTVGATPVAVINQSMAKQFWPGEKPLGKRFKSGGTNWTTIVGVAKNLSALDIYHTASPGCWIPATPQNAYLNALIIKTEREPMTAAGNVRQAVAALDKMQPIEELTSMADIYQDQLRPPQVFLGLLSTFALVALIMAVVGIFGLLSYTVEQRRHEFGIRLALGATRKNILTLVYKQAFAGITGGIVLGLMGTWFLTSYMSSVVFGVSPHDPSTLAGVILALAVSATIACWRPAWRAAHVDPAESLRCE